MTDPDPLAERLRADAARRRRPVPPALRARLHEALARAPASEPEPRHLLPQLALAAAILISLALALSWRQAGPDGPGTPRLPAARLAQRVLPGAFGGLAEQTYRERVSTPLAAELGAVVADVRSLGGNLFARVPRHLRQLLLPAPLRGE